MNGKSAYLHPVIKEKIYLQKPQNFERKVEKGTKIVCRLRKSIYGLKQAAKKWYDEMATFLIQQNLRRRKNDYCFFKSIKRSKTLRSQLGRRPSYCGTIAQEIEELKSTLGGKFKVYDRKKPHVVPRHANQSKEKLYSSKPGKLP